MAAAARRHHSRGDVMEGEVGSLEPMLEKLGCLLAKRNGRKIDERGRHQPRSEGKMVGMGW